MLQPVQVPIPIKAGTIVWAPVFFTNDFVKTVDFDKTGLYQAKAKNRPAVVVAQSSGSNWIIAPLSSTSNSAKDLRVTQQAVVHGKYVPPENNTGYLQWDSLFTVGVQFLEPIDEIQPNLIRPNNNKTLLPLIGALFK